MRLALALVAGLVVPSALSAACGGDFRSFVAELADEARAKGYDDDTVSRFLSSVRQDQGVLKADRAQGVFQMPFLDFSRRLISSQRLEKGRSLAKKHDGIFDRIERDYGVSRGVLLAFWAFETDYGGYQGDFNTLNALVTLAHDCRRPDLFRPQIFAALELYTRGAFDPTQDYRQRDARRGFWPEHDVERNAVPAMAFQESRDLVVWSRPVGLHRDNRLVA